MEWLWAVGVPVAAFVAVGLVKMFARFNAWVAGLIYDAIVEALEDRLQLGEMRRTLETIHNEVTLNGGGSLKDLVRGLQKQVEALHTDK